MEKDKIIKPEIYEVSENMKLEKRNAVMENSLIEARYNLSLEEQRLVLMTIAMLDNVEISPNGFPTLKIPKKKIIETTGMHEKDYKMIRKSLEKLMSRVIKIETEKGFELYQWFAKAKYNKGEDFIEVQFHPDLKPYLLELKKRFTKLPLEQILKLRSKYSIRLYELLKQYENTGFRLDYLKDLREMLGVEKNEYTRFSDFERRVLKPAAKEISEETDLAVEYEKKKTGRKITHIEFNVEKKKMLEGEKEKLKIAEPKKKQKEQVELVEAKEIEKEPVKSKVDKENTIWKDIYELRQKYQDLIEEILSSMKKERLTENQILFLIANADSEFVNSGFIKEAISSAVNNSKITNPMGFLIKTFNIDIKTAKFKELTLTSKKIDEKLFKEKLEDEFISAKPALALTKRYWKEEILPRNEKGEIDGFALDLLREPLKNAFYDDIDKIVYIPAPDEVYKDWFEGNYLEDIKEFMNEKFGIEDVVVELVE